MCACVFRSVLCLISQGEAVRHMGKVQATVPAVLGVLTGDGLVSFPVGALLEWQTGADHSVLRVRLMGHL